MHTNANDSRIYFKEVAEGAICTINENPAHFTKYVLKVLRKAGTLNKFIKEKGIDYIIKLRPRSYNTVNTKHLFAI